MKLIKKIGKILLVTAFWIGVWAFAAWRIGKPLLFPTPKAVFLRLGELIRTEDFYRITANSLWNVFLGLLIAISLGVVLALITSRISFVRELVLPLMSVIKATPVASFIVLAIICLNVIFSAQTGSARVPTFIAILIVLPVVWTNLDEGFLKIDPKLSEVARVYRIPFFRRFRILIFPSVKPYFVSACRASIGLAWKAGISAEILAMPRNTIGTMIGEAKLYIETATMFAWTLTVILLSLVIEFFFTWLLGYWDKSKTKKEDA